MKDEDEKRKLVDDAAGTPMMVTDAAKGMEMIKANLTQIMSYQSIRAKINKELFDRMVEAGFSKQEALQFIIAKGF